MKKRMASLCMALLMAVQPAGAVMAQSERESVIRGEDYTIRTHVDGTQTMTFYADMEASDYPVEESENEIAGLMEEKDAPEVDVKIEGSGENAKVSLECGEMKITFTPEISEEEVLLQETQAVEAETSAVARKEPEQTKSANGTGEDTAKAESEAQAEKVTEAQAEKVTEAQAEKATEAPTEEVTEAPTEEVTEAPTEEVTEAPTEEVTEALTQENADTEAPQMETQITETEMTSEAGTESEKEPETEKEQIPDSEIRYTELEDGVKEELVIYGYRGGHKVDYNMCFTGLTPLQQGNEISLLSEDGVSCASISAPYLYDANGATCYDVEVRLVQMGAEQWQLTYIPSDAWLSDPARVYPVILDPTIKIDNNSVIEDNYVGDGENINHPYRETTMIAGNKGGKNYTAMLRPAFPDSIKEIASQIIITDAKVELYVMETGKSQDYSFYEVTETWSSTSVTGKNKPKCAASPFYTGALKKGSNTFDIKVLVSKWFNCLDQHENCGFAIKGEGKKGAYVVLASSDMIGEHYNDRAKFTIKYSKINTKTDPSFKAVPEGNELNSGSGYVNLSWKKITGAEAYYVGIHNGKEYEYFFVGNKRSFSTKGKGIWPTEEEIASGRYALHGDGGGTDLPCIPAFTYKNAGTKHAKSLNYYFRVVPANSYGQAIDPGTFDGVKTVLPDRIAPNQAAEVKAFPAGYMNGNSVTVSWSGVRDYNATAAAITDTLGSGRIQYSVDGIENWQDTDKNAASGSFTIDTSSCEDGQHSVYIRGRDGEGNTGTPKGVAFYVDRTGPQGQILTVQPSGWTREDQSVLSWSGMKELNIITGIEYRLDGGEWTDTGITEGSYTGFAIDTSNLADGEHTFALCGQDNIGNTGREEKISLLIDRTPPQAGTVSIAPKGWNANDKVTLSWDGASDGASGIAKLEYGIGGVWTVIEGTQSSGSVELDAAGLGDGEHEILFRVTDVAGNVSETASAILKRDTAEPKAAITSPADAAILDGVFTIKGRVFDDHIKSWSLTARDGESNEKIVAKGEKAAEGTLGSLDLSAYPDGENIELILRAEDAAGNMSESSVTVIRIGGSMEPMTNGLKISVAETMAEAKETGSYYPADSEKDTFLYIDGKSAETVSGGEFSIYGVRYQEGSTHTLSMISRCADGSVLYSQGLGTQQLIEELWETGAPTQDSIWQSTELCAASPMLALRLNVTDFTPDQSSIFYEYSIDGENWNVIDPDTDAIFEEPAERVLIRAKMQTDGENIPKLYRISVQGVIEMNPAAFTVYLERAAQTFEIKGPDRVTEALSRIAAAGKPEGVANWYLEGRAINFEEDLFDARFVQEDGSAALYGAAATSDGDLYLSGGQSGVLLREDQDLAGGTVESRDIPCSKGTAALRLCAAVKGGEASYDYSLDGGNTWQEIKTDEYTLLKEEAKSIRLRAILPDGAGLAGWQLEGYCAAGYTVTADLVQPPIQVTAADYGLSEKPRYELVWKDGQEADHTAAYVTQYKIYRNGEEIASTQECTWTDEDYKKGAVFEIEKLRVYEAKEDAAYLTRASAKVTAQNVTIETSKKEGVKKEVKEHQQEQQLSSLYGGGYTFTVNDKVPSAEMALNQSLLGKNKTCSLGFEPVNFNTGNFVLEAEDYALETSAGPGFSMLRTYNTQSSDTDGLFGAKWTSEYSQYLRLYEDGTIGYRKADGALVLFSPAGDGYTCSTADNLVLTEEGDGAYRIEESGGKTWHFTRYGLLDTIEEGGQCITLIRDERNVLMKVCLSDGREIGVETDDLGHITRLVQTGGAGISYCYDGNNLTSVTDTKGNTVRYSYDAKGRMTEWYDKAGNRQAYNEYDDQDRVIHQEDANEGVYTLEYFADHTVTTDAEGIRCEVWFDEQKRTIREVDGEGGEYFYAYDEAGNLTGKTDAEGRLTAYTYDENGNRTGIVLPDGTKTGYTYDQDGNLLSETDGCGNETRYEYDIEGRLTKKILPDGGVETYEYDQQGRLVLETNAIGAATAYRYDGEGNLKEMTDACGNVTAYEYDGEGRVTAETDALGNRTEYTYDEAGNLTALRKADGSETAYTYDAMGNMTSVTDGEGYVTEYVYDALSNCTEIHYPDGSAEKMEYTPGGLLAKKTDGLGNTTVYTYDNAGNQISETDALGRVTLREYDGNGLVTRMTLPNGAEETYIYEETTGLLIESTDTAGGVLRFEYDANGNVTAQYNEEGIIQLTAYDSLGRVSKTTDALGNVTSYAYDQAGNLIKVTDALGNETSYVYDALGRMTAQVDALGNETIYEYDAVGQKISETDARGAKTCYAYDTAGNLIKVTNAYGRETTWAYDSRALLLRETDACGSVTAYEYDACGRKIKEILPDGGENTYYYDAAGNLTEEAFPEGGSVSYGYDAAGQQVSMTDVFGKKAEVSYDALGNTVKTVDGEGSVTSYTYDAAGRLTGQTDEAGSSILYTYDEIGRIASMQNGDSYLTYDYDGNGNVTAVTDGTGSRVSYAYDALGQMTEVIYADGSIDSYEYDALGRLIFMESHDGSYEGYTYDVCGNVESRNDNSTLTTFEYDLLGNMIKKTTGGVSTAYEYDACGRVTKETDHEGNSTSYEIDASGRIAAVTIPGGARMECGYDRNGRLISMTDALGHTTEYTYDEADRLTGVTDALGNTTAYTYDAWDQIASVTDALGHTTQYTYDATGKLLAETDALGNTQSYEYTVEGWLSKKTGADGKETGYTYDGAGNVTQIRYADGSTAEQAWDTSGRLTEISGVDGKTSYRYDEGGRLIKATYPDGQTVGYEYDEKGSRTALIYPDGRKTLYAYDSFGRLTKVTEPGGREITYTYDALGRRTGMSDGEDTTTYTYDGRGNVTGIVTGGGTELSLAYTYDECGNILTEMRTEDGKEVTSMYTYDALNRLTSWKTDDGREETYTYDAAGNMTAKETDGQRLAMAYDGADRMVSMSGENGTVIYRYDADGNLTEKSYGELTDSYSYDDAGRLSSFTGYDGSSVSYAYNAAGQVAEKISSGNEARRTLEELLEGGVHMEGVNNGSAGADGGDAVQTDDAAMHTTSYIYDTTQEHAQVLSECTDGRETIYTYGLERTAAYAGAAGNRVRMGYAYDARGSVIRIGIEGVSQAGITEVLTGIPRIESAGALAGIFNTDPAKAMGTAEYMIRSCRYTPYGEQLLGEGEEKQSGYLYNGESYDSVTGSYYLRARFYEPGMMRFCQKDRVRGNAQEPQSLNRYAYVRNNPVTYADPGGENPLLVIAGLYAMGKGLRATADYAAKSYVQTTQAVQKTTNQFIKTISANAGFQAIVSALEKTPLGYVVVQTAKGVIKVATKAQAQAVADAQAAYKALESGKGDAKELAKKLMQACAAYAGKKDSDYYEYRQYGFDDETIRLLKKLRKNIDRSYADFSQKERDWLYSHIVGSFAYGNPEMGDMIEAIKWVATAGPITTVSSYKEAMMHDFNFSEDEYNYLSYKIRAQNQISGQQKVVTLNDKKKAAEYKANMEFALGRKLNDKEFERLWEKQQKEMMGKGDYAHGQITTASILNPYNGGLLHWMATRAAKTDREGLKDMAGWLGDATLKGEKGFTSFGNDDYIADLDAENITHYMEKYKLSYQKAAKKYYKELESGNTRAKIFCTIHKYKDVKKEVLQRLKVKNMKELKKKQPDTYKFLVSLKKGLNEMKK